MHRRPNFVSTFDVKRPPYGAILLGLIPFAGMCFSVSAWDRVYPIVFGLPFNFFWLLLWIFLTPLCMWAAYYVQASRSSESPQRYRNEKPSR
jgi:hypothetical protein